MEIINTMKDKVVLKLIGGRISESRLVKNLTQNNLAIQAGVSKSTVVRIEDGRSIQMINLIRILRAMELLPNLDAFIPEAQVSPVELLKSRGKKRQRASRRKAYADTPKKWVWGDEQ